MLPYNSYGTYRIDTLIPRFMGEWDTYETRLARYEIFDGYYHNIAYHSLISYSQALKVTEKLYKHVRGVYNPCMRIVELYVNKTYGGELDMQTAETGAIPITSDNPRVLDAITQLWEASQWGQKKSLFVRQGAKFGDVYLKIVDNPSRGTVKMEVLDPRKLKELVLSPDGEIEKAVIEYMIDIGDMSQTYTEVITRDRYETYLDNYPHAFHANARGEMLSSWDNDYGFVPIAHVMHRDAGMLYGANAYYNTLHKINELNDIASINNDAMRKQANMPLVFINAQLGTTDLGSDSSNNTLDRTDLPKKDTLKGINLVGENADVRALPPALDIVGTLQAIDSGLRELERDLPELALHRIREGGNLTAPGVRSAYDDGISRIKESRGNYDTGLIEAQRMALAIGGMRGYEGYQGFSLASLDNGDVNHQIATRPVINETLSNAEMVQLTLQAIQTNAPAPIYKKLGWADSDIEAIEASQSLRTNMSLMTLQGEPSLPDPNETPEDAARAVRERRVNENTILDANELLVEVS